MNHSLRRCAVSCLVAIAVSFFSPQLYAQASASPDPTKQRLDIIKFGIDTELMDLLGQLEKEKNDAFNDELLTVFESSRNLKLRQALLDFYSKREWRGAENAVAGIVRNWDDEEEKLVASCIQYGVALKSKAVLDAGRGIFDEESSALLQPMVRLAGVAGGVAETEKLLAILDGEPSEALSHAVIQSLGFSGGGQAVARLVSILENAESGKFARIYACESLGRLADPTALGAVLKAATDADPNLRSSALSSLGSIDSPQTRKVVMEGLRDSNEGVRIQAARSASKLGMQDAVEALLYKLSNDPSMKVKEASMRSLADLGSATGWQSLRAYLLERKNPESLRLLVLRLILEKKESGSYGAVREAFEAEAKEKSAIGLQRMALVFSENESPGLDDLAVRFMNHADYIVRTYGADWVKRNKASTLRAELERLSSDPSELVRKRAAQALEAIK